MVILKYIQFLKTMKRNKQEDPVGLWLKSILTNYGLKSGKDFRISDGHVFFEVEPDRNKKTRIQNTISQYFPQFTFTWSSKKMLEWF